MKTKTVLLLVLLFIAINTGTYYNRNINVNKLIDIVLTEKLSTLTTHYTLLLETQRKRAVAVYKSTMQMDRVIEIMSEASSASKERKAELREEFNKLVSPIYKILQLEDVYQYQFVFPTNESFYRAHMPNNFGDDLTDVRADFEYTNTTHKPIKEFTQGKTTHAFRNVFPLFDKNKNYIGAMEVSFSSDSFQWYLNDISSIHSHFILDKKIFSENTWEREDMALKYSQSAEQKNYMLRLGETHTQELCIVANSAKLASIKEEIDSKVILGKAFSTYVKYNNNVTIVSFLPITNIEKKVVAWIVTYEKSPIIKSTLTHTLVTRIVIFLLSLLLIYFIVKQISLNTSLELKTKEQNALLSLFNKGDFVLFQWSNDEAWSVEHVSDSIEELLGYTKAEFFDKRITYIECVHPEDVQDVLKEIELGSHSREGYFEHNPYRVITKNNEVKWVRDRTMIVKDANKNIVFYVGYINDITKMKELQITTETKAYTDGMTGINNRNKFDEIFEEEIKNVQRYKNPLSIAILDIDKFKDFNDKYGHLIGDEVLIMIAQTVNNSVRDTDIFARWGGEEFVILFKNTPADVAKEVSQKLKDKIEENEHPSAGKITASFGVTEYKDGDTLETIFKRCDDALYVAKENGRNRVEVL